MHQILPDPAIHLLPSSHEVRGRLLLLSPSYSDVSLCLSVLLLRGHRVTVQSMHQSQIP